MTIIGSSLTMIQEYTAFWTGRAILGLGFGITNAVSPMFIAEIATKKLHPILAVMIQLWINLGILAPLVMNFLLPVFRRPNSAVENYCLELKSEHIAWREILGVPIIVALLQLLALLLVFKKENPIYVDHIRCKAGSDSFEESFNTQTESDVGSSFNFEIQQASQKKSTKLEKDTWKRLLKPSEKRKVIACCVVRVALQLSGISLVLNFAYPFVITVDDPQINLRFFLSVMGLIYIPISMWLLTR